MTTTTTSPNSATTSTSEDVGLFIVSYEIGGNMPGAPTFVVHLTVDTVRKSVSGQGRITNTSNPPLDLRTNLEGDYTYMTVMPNSTSILVTLTGYPVVEWPRGGGIGPVLLPNANLRMVLDPSWASGTANYKYTTDGSSWQTVSDAPVRKVDSPSPDAVGGVGGRIIMLLAESASASWSEGQLVIHAEGHEDGVRNIRIERLANQLFPPQFSVVGEPSPAIGLFPYAVTGSFAVSPKPVEIALVSPEGTKQIPVT